MDYYLNVIIELQNKKTRKIFFLFKFYKNVNDNYYYDKDII